MTTGKHADQEGFEVADLFGTWQSLITPHSTSPRAALTGQALLTT
jgi:hypothetical protein